MKNSLVIVVTFVIFLSIHAQYLRCQSPEKQSDDWPAMLKKDPRLQARVTYNHFKGRPTAEEWFAVLHKATGVKFAIASQEVKGKVTFAVGSGSAPAWLIMQLIAQQQVLDGKWQKTEDGYVLHGKPKGQPLGMAILTPDAEAEEAAKVEARKKAVTNADPPKGPFGLPKDHPLWADPKQSVPPKVETKAPPDPPGPGAHHADPRLRKRVTINVAMPKVDAALDKLGETTGVRFTFAGIQNERPAVNGIFVNGVPAWEVMDAFAADKKVDGRWEKDGDGYRLVPRGEPLPIPPDDVAAEAKSLMQIIVVIGVVLTVLLAGGGLCFLLWRRAKRTS